MSDWRSTSLGEEADEITVGHVGPMADRYVAAGIPFLRSQNIAPHRLRMDDVKFIDRGFHEDLKKSVLRPGDVVIVRTGKPGTTAIIPDSLPVANCADLVIVRAGQNLDARWLSYYLNGAAAGYVSSRLVGAVQQHFNVGAAREMSILLPPLAEQRAIGEILGTVDDKIESNRRSAEISEQCLGLFSAVRPDSPVVSLADLAVVDRDAIDPAVLEGPVDHYSIPAFDAARWPDRCDSLSIKSSKLVVQTPSLLLSRLNPGTPRLWFAVPESLVPALASTEFMAMRPTNGLTLGDLWVACSDPLFIEVMGRRATGTSGSHQRIRPADALSIDVVDPRSLPDRIRTEASDLLQFVRQRRIESRSLSALRDALLPELLSGRLRVPEAEQLVSEVP